MRHSRPAARETRPRWGWPSNSPAQVVLPEWRVEGRSLRPPTPVATEGAQTSRTRGTDFGLVNLTEDGDQFVRRQQLAVRTGKESVAYQFALALMAKGRAGRPSVDPVRGSCLLGDEAVPLDADQMLRINFIGPPGTIPTIAALPGAGGRPGPCSRCRRCARDRDRREHRAGEAGRPQHPLQQPIRRLPAPDGRRVDVRAGDPREHRRHTPGPGVHHHAVVAVVLALVLALGAILGQAFFRMGLGCGFLLAVVHHFGWKVFALVAFLYGHWRVEMAGMLLLGAMAYSVAFAWRWRVLRQVLRAVKSAPIAQAPRSGSRPVAARGRIADGHRVVRRTSADSRPTRRAAPRPRSSRS